MPWISTTQLADLCGTTPRTVRKRCQPLQSRTGERNATLYDSREALPVILSLDDDDRGELERQRTRLTRAQADLTELQIEKLRGTLIEASVVERVQGAMISAFRARMLSLPAKAAPFVIGFDDEAEAQQLLEELVYEALNELADWDAGQYMEAPPQDDEAAAEADGEPVGGREPDPKPRKQRRARPVAH